LTRYNTRALVESALLAVIGMILVLIGEYLPFIGMIALFLWPLPSALVVLRHGMRWGVMASVLTALCLTFFTASVISYYISQHGLPKLFSVLAIFYVVANPVLSVLAVFFGIIDILFDFRRLRYGYLNDM